MCMGFRCFRVFFGYSVRWDCGFFRDFVGLVLCCVIESFWVFFWVISGFLGVLWVLLGSGFGFEMVVFRFGVLGGFLVCVGFCLGFGVWFGCWFLCLLLVGFPVGDCWCFLALRCDLGCWVCYELRWFGCLVLSVAVGLLVFCCFGLVSCLMLCYLVWLVKDYFGLLILFVGVVLRVWLCLVCWCCLVW